MEEPENEVIPWQVKLGTDNFAQCILHSISLHVEW